MNQTAMTTRTTTTTTSVSPAEVAKFDVMASAAVNTNNRGQDPASAIHSSSTPSWWWWDPQCNPLVNMNELRMQYMLTRVRAHFQDYMFDPLRKNGVDGSTQSRPSSSSSSSSDVLVQQQKQQHPRPFLRVLDVGCGGGLVSESWARCGLAHTVVGIDPSTGSLMQMAQHHAYQTLPRVAQERLMYRPGMTVEALAYEMEHQHQQQQQQQESASASSSSSSQQLFDVICLLEVIEHVTDIPAVLRSIGMLLRPPQHINNNNNRNSSNGLIDGPCDYPGGLLFVSTINRTWISFLVTIVGAEYVMRYLPPGTHDWSRYQSPQDMEQWLFRSTTSVPAGVLLSPSANTTTTAAVLNDGWVWETIDVQGMVLAELPSPFHTNWKWKLNRHCLDINWIGTYGKNTATRGMVST